jgi:hypothetical protein
MNEEKRINPPCFGHELNMSMLRDACCTYHSCDPTNAGKKKAEFSGYEMNMGLTRIIM